jgi:hypothetical protein
MSVEKREVAKRQVESPLMVFGKHFSISISHVPNKTEPFCFFIKLYCN